MIYAEPNSFLSRCVPREVDLLLPRCASCGVGKAKLTKGFNTLAVTNYILLNSFIINKRRTNTSNPYTGYIFVETRWCRIASLMSDCCIRVGSLDSNRIFSLMSSRCIDVKLLHQFRVVALLSNRFTDSEILRSRQIVSVKSDHYARVESLRFCLISIFCHILASPAKSRDIFTGQISLFVSLLRRKSKNKLIRP